MALQKEFIDKKVSDELEQVIENRKTVILGEDGKNVIPLYNDDDESKYSSQVISPIIAEGDVIGSVIIISKEDEKLGELESKLAETAAVFLGKQMEQ